MDGLQGPNLYAFIASSCLLTNIFGHSAQCLVSHTMGSRIVANTPLPQVSMQFNDPTLQEAVRIVPMRLRVVGFTPSEIPEFPDRPTIHVEGETAGPAGSSSVRKVHGQVGMIADGNIRWTLVSTQ